MIRAELKARNLSQDVIATRAGLDTQIVLKVESGYGKIGIGYLNRIVDEVFTHKRIGEARSLLRKITFERRENAREEVRKIPHATSPTIRRFQLQNRKAS